VGSIRSKLSITEQSLDRAAFVAYFLGAIVPLVALAWVLQTWVIRAVDDETRARLVLVAVSIGVLSAGAFLLLRHATRRSLAEVSADNGRLEVSLETSARLAQGDHAGELAGTAVAAALRLTDAAGAFLVALATGAPPKLEAAAGERALFDAVAARLAELGELAAEPALWADPAGSGAAFPVAGVGLLAVATAPGGRMAPTAVRALAMLATQTSVALRRAQLLDAQRNFFAHVTDVLVAALDTHMDVQAGHARRVAQLSNRLGRELGLDDARRQRLHFAALLHDVGMLKIERTRLDDPRALRQHAQLGHRMLAPIQLWSDVAPLVLHHHEWWDGSGYPDRLAGEAIPLESRIIGVAEAFDSMTSTPSYQPAVTLEEAVRRVETGSGTQFDPAVVRVFLELARRGDLDFA
jgi:HD-GYP domain-containing protein (c-di-GMP phosphodiesterase class II)